MERRFIEEDFPIKEIGKESAREKNIRANNIATLHIWWARRPQATSRATNYAALISMNFLKNEKIKDFIAKLSNRDNTLNQNIIKKARQDILENNFKTPPKILDPFAGGGSIPLEALRLGCETYACDYNPVSTLILKCLLEFPNLSPEKNNGKSFLEKETSSMLKNDVKKYGSQLLDEVKKELSFVYDSDDEFKISCYLWAKTIPCQNPNCRKEIPLMRQYWLANTKRKITLYPIIEKGNLKFSIIGKNKPIPKTFDPSIGTISKAIVNCPFCKHAINAKITRNLFQNKKDGRRLMAIVSQGKRRKEYRLPNEKDLESFEKCKSLFIKKEKIFFEQFGISAIPDEELVRTSGNQMAPLHYGVQKWGGLFNHRQKLVLITLNEKLRLLYPKILEECQNPEYAKAITSYLALLIDKIASSSNEFCRWQVSRETIADIFGRQAIPMIWDYPETNILFGHSRSFEELFKDILSLLSSLSISEKPGIVTNSSAIDLPYPDEYFDAVFTDPPYYDNIFYSNLSDFFYVWLKRSVGFLYPELFSTPLTPKSQEIVHDPIRHKNKIKSKLFFENNLKASFFEIYRVLKQDGIASIVYAHKSTEGWETLINSILDSGLVVTAAWPINTEMKTRLLAKDSASLASSIYMICRKWKKEPLGFYRDVKKELKEYLNKKLEHLWNEGILGADFFISAIGSAIEVFGKYEKVVDDKDEQISVLRLLNDTRSIVIDYAINKVIKGEFSDKISQMTRFYILWRWAYGEAKVPFNDALKMAQSVGINLEDEWNKGFIIKDKDVIRVTGPQDRNEDKLEDIHELIDVLHKTLLIWRTGEKERLEKFLEEKNLKNSEMFKRVAQAISESLSLESTEKKWLDGFLTGFKSDDSQVGSQKKLF